jgi:hypothetical protein
MTLIVTFSAAQAHQSSASSETRLNVTQTAIASEAVRTTAHRSTMRAAPAGVPSSTAAIEAAPRTPMAYSALHLGFGTARGRPATTAS